MITIRAYNEKNVCIDFFDISEAKYDLEKITENYKVMKRGRGYSELKFEVIQNGEIITTKYL